MGKGEGEKLEGREGDLARIRMEARWYNAYKCAYYAISFMYSKLAQWVGEKKKRKEKRKGKGEDENRGKTV